MVAVVQLVTLCHSKSIKEVPKSKLQIPGLVPVDYESGYVWKYLQLLIIAAEVEADKALVPGKSRQKRLRGDSHPLKASLHLTTLEARQGSNSFIPWSIQNPYYTL